MSQKQEIQQAAKQLQRLILSPQMQQALQLLQMPVMELSSLITEEVAHNPLLDLQEEAPVEEWGPHHCRLQNTDREGEDLKGFIENTIAYETSLYDLLLGQAHETFEKPETLELAEWIIGNIDENGFLTTPIEELCLLSNRPESELLSVLSTIQTFDPPGIAARSLQESLLIQLKYFHKENSLAYRLVEAGFEDILKNKMQALAKKFNSPTEEIYHTIAKEVAPLDFHPGQNFSSGHYRDLSPEIIPDIFIDWVDEKFTIDINQPPLPPLRVNQHYLELLKDPSTDSDLKSYLDERLQSGKWLIRNLQERQHTLYRIAEQLVVIQGSYFKEPHGQLIPLTMKELAEKLSLHESTIARAVAHKYLSCPRGIFPIKSLFTHAFVTASGDTISSKHVKQYVREMVDNEDKCKPLSDDTLSAMIQEKGIPCARRTVAKYRQELGIGNTLQRKKYAK